MRTALISLFAIITTLGTGAFAADCPCKDGNCNKPKKQRIIYITAHDPDGVYGDPVFQDTVIPPSEPSVQEIAPFDGTMPPVPCGCGDCATPAPCGCNKPLCLTNHDWYVGARVGIHMLSWKNKYKAAPGNHYDYDFDSDKYTFEPVFGGGVFAGHRFTPSWRGDVEFGYITQFSDSDSGITFKLNTPYLMGNAYYDFDGGFYLGAGVGFAFPEITMDWEHFVTSDSSSRTKLSLIGGLMAGFGHRLSDSVVLDLRYRLAGFYGPTLTRNVTGFGTLATLETKVGFVLDNSLSVGLRYEF